MLDSVMPVEEAAIDFLEFTENGIEVVINGTTPGVHPNQVMVPFNKPNRSRHLQSTIPVAGMRFFRSFRSFR